MSAPPVAQEVAPPRAVAPPGDADAGGIRYGLAANVLLRVAGQAAGLALTLRLSGLGSIVGPSEVGFLGGLADAMELVVAIPAGSLSDRFGRRPLLLGGAIAGATGLLITGFADSLPLFTLGRAIQGLGTGCTIPPLLGWFSDATAARGAGQRGRVMAGVEAGTAAGLLGGTVLGTVVWNALREGAFPLLAVIFLAATALFARAPGFEGRRRPGPPAGSGRLGWLEGMREVLQTPRLPRLLIAWVLLNSVVGLWLTHAVYQLGAPAGDPQQFLVGRFHGTTLSLVLGAWMTLFIAGSLAWGPLLARVGEWRTMRVALWGMLMVCASLVLLNAGWAPPALRWAALLPFCIGVVMEAGFAPAALAQLAVDASQARRGLTMGLYSVAFGTGSLLGNWAGAPFAAAWAMNGIVLATAIAAALALSTLSLGLREAQDRTPDQAQD